MALSWSADDIKDLRADLADINNRWPEEDLNRLMGRASRMYPAGTTSQWVDIACAMALASLLPNAAKFSDWVIAEEQRKASDVWRQLNQTYRNKLEMAHVRAALNLDGGAGSEPRMGSLGYTRTRGRSDEFSPVG